VQQAARLRYTQVGVLPTGLTGVLRYQVVLRYCTMAGIFKGIFNFHIFNLCVRDQTETTPTIDED
jgi:hypothetical protein